MSKVKIEGNASGSGTLTISAPATNTDRSLTLPDGAGEILTDASTLSSSNLSGALPAIDGSSLTNLPIGYGSFQANFTAGIAISNTTFTKIAFDTSVTDSDSLYDTSNYRYTPDVAGIYYINSFVQIQGWISTGSYGLLEIRKNGSRYKSFVHVPNTSEYPTISGNALVDMNGTTDYIEIYIYQSSGSVKNIYANKESSFEGYLARAT